MVNVLWAVYRKSKNDRTIKIKAKSASDAKKKYIKMNLYKAKPKQLSAIRVHFKRVTKNGRT